MRRILPLLVLAFALPTSAWGEATPLVEELDTRRTYWTLSLLGGGAFPVASYADNHELGLSARATLAFNHKSGLGAGFSAGYSPLPAIELGDGIRRDNHVGLATIAPRYTLGRGTLRLFLGGGGGVVYERSTASPRSGEGATETSSQAEAAAVAEAGLELHFADTGGITIGGTYLYGVGDVKAQMAAAQAGFVLSF